MIGIILPHHCKNQGSDRKVFLLWQEKGRNTFLVGRYGEKFPDVFILRCSIITTVNKCIFVLGYN